MLPMLTSACFISSLPVLTGPDDFSDEDDDEEEGEMVPS